MSLVVLPLLPQTENVETFIHILKLSINFMLLKVSRVVPSMVLFFKTRRLVFVSLFLNTLNALSLSKLRMI